MNEVKEDSLEPYSSMLCSEMNIIIIGAVDLVTSPNFVLEGVEKPREVANTSI